MSRLLKITDNGNGILVQGTDNILYPDNATLTFPYNSIILVTDESDIATFRSASNNDVLFSGLIGKIEIGSTTVTKANIIDKFDEIANQESGGGEPFDPTDYYTKSQTNALLDEKADTSDLPIDVSELNNDVGYITDSALEDYFDGAEYDSNTRRINFKHGNTIKAYIDANAFIKDGMVENVEISNGNLVITFNTDAGKQPISIPLTDIFNPANYYTKSEVDAELDTKQDISDAFSGDYNDLTNKPTIPDVSNYVDIDTYNKKEVAIANALIDLNDNKADKTEIPVVPTNVSAFTNDAGYLTQHQSLTDYYTKTETDQAIDAALADIDLSDYVDKETFDTKEEVISTALNELDANKQDVLTAGANITIQNNVISASGAAAQIQSDWNQTNTSSVDYIKNKPTIPVVPDMTNYYTKTETDDIIVEKEEVVARALTELKEEKADKSEIPVVPDMSNYYTKSETDNTFVTQAVFDVKEEVISSALNNLDERIGNINTILASI